MPVAEAKEFKEVQTFFWTHGAGRGGGRDLGKGGEIFSQKGKLVGWGGKR